MIIQVSEAISKPTIGGKALQGVPPRVAAMWGSTSARD
jgi:hypothetical protein